MSIEAISHVLKLDIARSSEKFVLACLANYADSRGFTYPSVAQLEADTSQDRKTVLGNLRRLVEGALLKDTGRRVGATRQVIVYQIMGLPESSISHYVYKLTHPTTGEFYVGKRSCNGHPELDAYRGSGRWPVQMRAGQVMLVREVLATYPTSEEAIAFEAQTIRRCDGDPLCRNEDTSSRTRARQGQWLKGTENGTVEESQFSGETVPLFPDNSPNSPSEQSQKRDTEPSSNHQGTKQPGARAAREAFESAGLPDWWPMEAWKAYLEVRHKKRAVLTQTGKARLITKVKGYHAAGVDVAEVFMQSVENGWTGIFEPRAKDRMAAARAAAHGEWSVDEEGIKRKGAEIGIAMRADETMSSYRDRIKQRLERRAG